MMVVLCPCCMGQRFKAKCNSVAIVNTEDVASDPAVHAITSLKVHKTADQSCKNVHLVNGHQNAQLGDRIRHSLTASSTWRSTVSPLINKKACANGVHFHSLQM